MFLDNFGSNTKVTPAKSLPLFMAGIGEQLRIVSISAGHTAQTRLTELGLPVGQEITVLQRQHRGPMVVAVGDARVALGFGLSSKVFVTPVDQPREER